MNIKKKLMVILASAVMAFSASPFVLAATPAPAGNTTATLIPMEGSATIAPAAGGIASSQEAVREEVSDSKYLTKGGAAFWFIFTIALNAVLSFWVGNRFYRLAKKDNHVSAEIRALRKDVEEKFVKSVGGFAEQEVDINNLNESLATDEDGIKAEPKLKPNVLREVSEEEEERFRRWEEAQSRPKGERVRPSQKSAVKEELDDDFETIRRIKRKNYQPKREEREDVFDDEIGSTRKIKLKSDKGISSGDNVKSRAKEILGDIFPFKED